MKVEKTDKKDPINFIKGEVKDKYQIFKTINEDGFSKIYLIKSRTSEEVRCLKRISKSNLENIDILKKDLILLSNADNPNIVNIIEVFISFSYYDVIMEYCQGGNVLDKVASLTQKGKFFTNYQAAEILKQILIALQYAHFNNIMHTSLSLENILFVNKDPENFHIKVLNLGISKNYKKEFIKIRNKMRVCYFSSPEALEGNCHKKSDIWSCGVILYILLLGLPPFFSDVEGESKIIQHKIMSYDYRFLNRHGINMSEDAKDLISKILCQENKRLKIDQILSHQFFIESNKQTIPEDMKITLMHNLMEYYDSNKMQRILFKILAYRFSYDEIKNLNQIFSVFDKDNNGVISRREFHKGMKMIKSDITLEEIDKFFDTLDYDDSKKVNYTEFIAASINKKIFDNKEKLLEIFESLDTSKDGKISYIEFRKFIHDNKSVKEEFFDFKEEFRKIDQNEDGTIDKEEFLQILKLNNHLRIKNDIESTYINDTKNEGGCCDGDNCNIL